MTMNDYRLKENEIQILSSLKEKKFNCIIADNAFGGTKSIRHALFSVGNKFYTFNNEIVPLDYYGSGVEDVAILSFSMASENLIHEERSFERAIELPIKQKIKDVAVVTETQKVFENSILNYETILTRGVIFYLFDGYEVSFEKDIWFSEIIKIQKGYNLIDKFSSKKEFEEDWTGNYSAQCVRVCELL